MIYDVPASQSTGHDFVKFQLNNQIYGRRFISSIKYVARFNSKNTLIIVTYVKISNEKVIFKKIQIKDNIINKFKRMTFV